MQFYRTDDYLVECVAGYLADALWRRENTIVIATAEHRVALEGRLRTKGVDLVTTTVRRQFLALDAREMLGKFMFEGRPNAEAFASAVGALVAEATAAGARLRAFGEMVALLWMEGRREAAIELERLWNELGQRHEFALFCAYPAACTDAGGDGPNAAHICGAHSSVVSLFE